MRKLKANDACEREDVCGDPHARCDSGLCRCVPGYSVVDGVCGEITTPPLLWALLYIFSVQQQSVSMFNVVSCVVICQLMACSDFVCLSLLGVQNVESSLDGTLILILVQGSGVVLVLHVWPVEGVTV